MLIGRAERFKAPDVTDETLYLNRREFIAGGAAAVALGAYDVADAAAPPAAAPPKGGRNRGASGKGAGPPPGAATGSNNFYPVGVSKAGSGPEGAWVKARPWA